MRTTRGIKVFADSPARRAVLAVAVWALAALAFFGVLVVLEEAVVNVGDLTRDTAAVADVPFWTGAISMLGLWIWAAVAGACFTAGMALRARGAHTERAWYLLGLSAISALMLFDDGYLGHENLVPSLLSTPFPERITLGALGLFALAVAYRFRKVILAGRPLLLILATACFAASFLMDGLGVKHGSFSIEDYVKFVGLGTFLVYSLREAHDALLERDQDEALTGPEPRRPARAGAPAAASGLDRGGFEPPSNG
jgi:hypothetical protein